MTYNLLYTSEEIEKEKALVKLRVLEENLEELLCTIDPELFELKNMLQTAILIVEQAIENRSFEKKKFVIKSGKPKF